MIRYLPYSLYFNFHYLPFVKAIKLPILLCKPSFRCLKGSGRIESSTIKTGMIKIGNHDVSIYPQNGCILQINGEIVFKGRCRLGSGTSIAVGSSGSLIFEDEVVATAEFKVVCYKSIMIGRRVTFGWECLVMDTNLHRCVPSPGGGNATVNAGYSPVSIGDETWIAFRCTILPGSKIPHRCIIAANSTTNKRYDLPYTMLGGMPAHVIKDGLWMNRGNDYINYFS